MGTVGGRTSVTIVSGRFHTSARSVTVMPGTSHFPALRGSFRAGIEGPITRCRLLVPYGGLKVDSASVGVGQHGRNRGLLDISVTGSDSRHGSVSPPTHSRDAPVHDPPLPAHPPLSPRPQPARAVARGAGPLPRAPACLGPQPSPARAPGGVRRNGRIGPRGADALVPPPGSAAGHPTPVSAEPEAEDRAEPTGGHRRAQNSGFARSMRGIRSSPLPYRLFKPAFAPPEAFVAEHVDRPADLVADDVVVGRSGRRLGHRLELAELLRCFGGVHGSTVARIPLLIPKICTFGTPDLTWAAGVGRIAGRGAGGR